jgi:hypothetical protein
VICEIQYTHFDTNHVLLRRTPFVEKAPKVDDESEAQIAAKERTYEKILLHNGGFPTMAKYGEHTIQYQLYNNVSNELRALIGDLLNPNPMERCNIEKLTNHEWLQNVSK